jgi:voltage-gated potassium channel Kch
MNKKSFYRRISYSFDELMSRGPIAMIGLLAVLSFLIILFAGLLISLLGLHSPGDEPMNFIEAFWQSLMRALDSGTMGGDQGWSYRTITFFVTIGGIFIISMLIGVLSSGIEGKLSELQKGKSIVLEKDFILILGWSSKIFTIISELLIANESARKPCIVILADKDKVEMEDEIRNKLGNLKNMKIVCRNGKPHHLEDLEIANPNESKSIILLSSEEVNADYLTIKTLLAITQNPTRRITPYHLTVEINDRKNLDIARSVGEDEVELILSDEIISRIMVQTARQSGLSVVYSELLDFDGDEIYFFKDTSVYGRLYGDVLFKFRNSTVIGILNAEEQVSINPSMEYQIQPNDKIILIAEDDSTIKISDDTVFSIQENLIVKPNVVIKNPESILLLGWNKRGLIILSELDKYLAPKSFVKIISTFDIDSELLTEIKNKLNNIILEFQQADSTSKEVIENAGIQSFDSIQILCYTEELELQEADANTLITLLHLRKIMDQKALKIKIVSEMLDIKNRDLAQITKADDFVVSDKIISLLMSQVSENKHLMKVYDDLFNAKGSEIYLKPVIDYIKPEEDVNFYTVIESVKKQNQTALGYRLSNFAHDSSKNFGIVLNPEKSITINFSSNDFLIVLSEE